MPKIQSTVVAVRTEILFTTIAGGFQSLVVPATRSVMRAGTWAGETAQKFGALLSDLMGPAVFTVYSLAAWSLAGNLGWTDSFFFSTGPLSNWIVWLGIAIMLNVSASILRRHVQGQDLQK